jgi:hypothetical protein
MLKSVLVLLALVILGVTALLAFLPSTSGFIEKNFTEFFQFLESYAYFRGLKLWHPFMGMFFGIVLVLFFL